MASMRHEILVEIFKNRPSLATELLIESLHIPQPTFDETRLASIDLTEVQPAEYRADVVVVLYHNEKPIRVNIVEVQLAIITTSCIGRSTRLLDVLWRRR